MEELQLSSVSTGNEVMVVPAGVYAAEFDIVSEGGTYREMVGTACGATERSLYEVVLPPSASNATANTEYVPAPADDHVTGS